jgi:hypothetical protein
MDMKLPRGKGWEWLSRVRGLVWLAGVLVAGIIALWSRFDRLPGPVIGVIALAAFALVLISAAAARHLFAEAPASPMVAYPAGSRSEEYVIESLRRAEEDRRRLEEEAKKEREQQLAVRREFEKLEQQYEASDASRAQLERLFGEMTHTVDRLLKTNEGAQRTLYEVDKALRTADLDAIRHWRPPKVVEGWPLSAEDAVQWASHIINDYRRERVAQIEQQSNAPTPSAE